MFFLGNWFASWWRKLTQTKALRKTRHLSPRRKRFPLMLEALGGSRGETLEHASLC
jgi:hypothetical protein